MFKGGGGLCHNGPMSLNILLLRKFWTWCRRLASGALVALVAAALLGSVHVSATTQWAPAGPVQFPNGVALGTSGRWVDVRDIDCAAVGECVAVGEFSNAIGGYESFMVVSTGGAWGQAVAPSFASGVRVTTSSAYGILRAVSCPSVGNCAAVGTVKTPAGIESFTITMTNGVWGQGEPVAFAGSVQNSTPFATLMSIDCPSVGNCAAGGQFKNAAGHIEAFTVTLTGGVWGQGAPVVFAAGVQTLHPVDGGYLRSVSCASAGNCTATGRFRSGTNSFEGFSVTQSNGTWGQARPVVFPAGVQASVPADELFSVDCTSAGNCTAVGAFTDVHGGYSTVVQSSVNGTWGQPHVGVFASGLLPAQLSQRIDALNRVSCTSAGNCVAVGFFYELGSIKRAFTMTQTNGTWGQAEPVALGSVAASNPFAELYVVDCSSVGNCVTAGHFVDTNGGRQGFTMTRTNGTWGQATPIVFPPGGQSNMPEVRLSAVSCASTSFCSVGGYYQDGSNLYQGVILESSASGGASPTTAPSSGGVPSTTTATSGVSSNSGNSENLAGSLPATGSDLLDGLIYAAFTVVAAGATALRVRRHMFR